MMAQGRDSEKTPNKDNGLDALVNGNSSGITPGSSERKAKHEDRIVQVSVSRHVDCLLSAIASSRHDATQADGILIVRDRIFNIHRLVVSTFSKVLREAFSSNSSQAVHVDNVEADVMGYILDWMYGNMAVLKESLLLSFLNAVRQLDIEMLQTPGILELEKKLLAKMTTQNSNAEMGDMKHLETVPYTISPSLSVTVMQAEDGKKIDMKYFMNTNSMKFPYIQDAYKYNSMRKTLEISNKEKKTHFCCCHCYKKACEETEGTKECEETKGKVEVTEEEDSNQSMAKRLEKCGTEVLNAHPCSLLNIPAWIFSSTEISVVPLKECMERSTPKRGYPNSVESKSTLSPSSSLDDDPIIIESESSKLSVDRVRRNLQPLLQARRHQEQYNYNEGGRKRLIGNRFDKTRTSPYPVSIKASNQGFRSRGVHTLRRSVQRVFSSGNDTPRIEKLSKDNTQMNSMISGLPQNRPQSIPITPPCVHAKRGRPKAQPERGSGSVVYKGDRGTRVRSEPLVQDTSKNYIPLIPCDQNEPVTVTDTGIITPPCVHEKRGRPKAQPERGSGSVVYKGDRGTRVRSEPLVQDTSKNYIPLIPCDQNEPVTVTDTGIITSPCVHAKRGRPKAQPESGSGSVVYKSYRGTCVRSEPLVQDTSENFIPLIPCDQNEPVTITDTGITVMLPYGAAEVLTKPSILKLASDSGKYIQLDNSDPSDSGKYAQLDNSDPSVTNVLHVSEGTPEMPSQPQHQSEEFSPSSIHMESPTTLIDEMSKSSEIESLRIYADSNNLSGLCSDEQSVLKEFDKTEKEVVEKSSTSLPLVLLKKVKETSGSHTFRIDNEDPSLKQDVESINSTDNIKEPDDAEGKCQLESNKKQKRRKLKGQRKKTYICAVCKKTFLNNMSMILHMRLHSGKKLYHCSSCDYHSAFYRHIKKHVSYKHGRTLAESEKKCKDAPLIDPSQAVDKPVKRKKNIDEQVKIDSELTNKGMDKDGQMQTESSQSINGMDVGSLHNKKQRKNDMKK